MKADLNLATPTSKQEVLDGLVLISDYYRYRRDEYVPPVLLPLELDRIEFLIKTDAEYLRLAEESLKSKHTEDIARRKDGFNKDLRENSCKIEQLPILMEEEITVCEQKFDEKIEELKTELRLKGVAYGESSAVAVLNAEKINAVAEIRSKYAEKQAVLENLSDYYLGEIQNAEQFFAKMHEEESQAKATELKNADMKYANEVHKYNEGQLEREIKYNNTIEQSEKKLHMEYMKIVYQGMTDEELLIKGYYRDVIEWVITYYRAMPDKVKAYDEYTSTTDYMIYLKDFYEQGVRLLYALAYGA